MAKIDFDKIEVELDVVVPSIYRRFIDSVNAKGIDLKKYGIYHTTNAVVKGNQRMRKYLGVSDVKWENDYFDFGVGDGGGNYFFLHATEEEDDLVQLWSHDPPGIEEVSTGTKFFAALMAELESGFTGPDKYRFQGNASWS